MKVNLHTDYAFRVLLFLAVNSSQKATIAEIAKFFSISHEHLRKVIHALAREKYIRTYTGRNGGMELLKAPEEINIKELFLFFESDDLMDCEDKKCTLSEYCTLQRVFDQAYGKFLDELGVHTLADLIHNHKMKVQLQTS